MLKLKIKNKMYNISKSKLQKCLDPFINTNKLSLLNMAQLVSNQPLYMKDFITEKEEQELLEHFQSQKWNTSLSRRTLHYGYEYDYSRKNTLHKTEPIPEWLKPCLERASEIFRIDFDQVLINEYVPGQGISKHIDNLDLFREIVVSITLGSQCVMVFQKDKDEKNVLLEKRSLVALTDEFRDKWTHMIPARKSDKVGKEVLKRGTRVSITFRKIKDGVKII